MSITTRRAAPPAARRWCQRVRKVGNSLVVTIPHEAVESLRLAPGQFVSFDLAPMELRPRLRPEVQTALDASWEDNADIYQELGRR